MGALKALRRFPALLGLVATYFICILAHQVYPAIWVLYTKYRFGWDTLHTGMSLAAVGVMAGVVQGGLTKPIIGRLGEVKTMRYGLIMATFFYAAYGLAWQGWMLYVCIITGSLSGLVTPAVQALMSHAVPADEQGELQGALASLSSVAGVIGPIICTRLFSFFISGHAPVLLPGAPFFWSGLLMLAALAVAIPALRRIAAIPRSAAAPGSSPAPSSH